MLLRVAILLLAVLLAQPALAERKVALLIGNATYVAPATELRNPPNDVIAMKKTLEDAGFEVLVVENAGRAAMSAALADFEHKVTGAEIGLIYYSGHGIEVSGENFLIPVDARLASDRDVKYETIVVDDLLQALGGATKLKLVLLDACRDNPFLTSMKRLATRGIPTRGLARVDSAESNMLIGYATAPGDVALDGDGAMSPYATALTRHLVVPGLEIEAALRAVAKDVFESTGGKQRPFKTGSLFETVMLGDDVAPSAAVSVGHGDPCRDAAAHWTEVRESKSASMFEDHIRLFPTCAFANIARQRLGELAPEVSVRGAASETECDRLASAENDPFMLASAKPVNFSAIDFARAVPACRQAIRDNPDEVRFPYQLGRSLDAAGEFEEAIAQYRKASDLGNHQAMRNLAILYERGEGIAQDYSEAMRLFRKSADLGNGLAMNNIGAFYNAGNGVERDYEEAMKWYRKSAETGVALAMLNVGDLYDEGLGVKKDNRESFAWYVKARDAGNVAALTRIGWAYENGRGVQKSATEALQSYRKAAAAGEAQAMNNIGTFYEAGRTVTKDKQEALKWYLQSAEKGNPYGSHNAAAMLDGGARGFEPETPVSKQAARWMEAALRLGHEPALRQMKENRRAWTLPFRKEMQQRLTDAGVYSGPIDGQFGPATDRAIDAIFNRSAT
jgi:TPR repeat protein